MIELKIKNIKATIEENEKLQQRLLNLQNYQYELEQQLNQIYNAKSFKLWQKFNLYKKVILANKSKIKRIPSKILNYIYLYKKNPKKFRMIQSIYKSNINATIINEMDQDFKIKDIKKQIDVIVPWYGDKNIFNLILNILKTDPQHLAKLTIINDCFPNQQISKKLENFVKNIQNNKIVYINQSKNKGFVGTVNEGLKLIQNDCIILNSDTLTTNNWLKKIIDVSEKNKKAATITPLSNNATIFSVPNFLEKNDDFNPEKTNAICEKIFTKKTLNVPTGHGYCMFIRKKYIDKYGFLDEKTFGKGYGEENDLCMRFSKHGLYNLALLNTYILHLESQSFGNKKRIEQIKNNYPKLLEKYPLYEDMIQDFIRINPLKATQDLIGFFREHYFLLKENVILIITHTNPYKIIGGVEIETLNLIQYLNNKHPNKSILLYCFDQSKNEFSLLIMNNGITIKQINFNKNINSENILIWILKTFKIELVMIEHLMNHSLSYGEILKQNKIKFILFIHDFFYFCKTADLLNDKNEFCKYEKNKNVCTKCLQSKFKIKINQMNWRKQSKKLIEKDSDVVIFNSDFTKDKYLKLFSIKPNKKFQISYPE